MGRVVGGCDVVKCSPNERLRAREMHARSRHRACEMRARVHDSHRVELAMKKLFAY